MENENDENQFSQGSREVSQRGRVIAAAAGVQLTCLKWHRGHEVADLDNWWLTLESSEDAITKKFSNEWLEEPGEPANARQINECLRNMVRALATSSPVPLRAS